MLPVIFGSSSKFRKLILKQEAPEIIPVQFVSADIDEYAITVRSDCPRDESDATLLTQAIAVAKADHILATLPDSTPESLLITCDQVCVHNGKIREKPVDADACRGYLRSYEDEPALTVAAIVVTNTRTKSRVSAVDIATQKFLPIPAPIVDALIEQGDIMKCCGGFRVDADELKPFLGERTGTHASLLGLPIELLKTLLTNPLVNTT